MAIIETGLGWYADENWLKQSYGEMGELSGSGGVSFHEVGVPYERVGYGSPYYLWTKNPTIGRPIFLCQLIRRDQKNKSWIMAFSADPAPSLYNALGSETAVTIDRTTPWGNIYRGYRYNVDVFGRADGSTPLVSMPTFYADNNEGRPGCEDAIDTYLDGQTQYFYKMNSGYAISCFAHYLNSENKMVYAPILISSTPAYTNISLQDPEGGTATNISTRYSVMQDPIEIIMGFGGEFEGSSLVTTGAAILEVGNTFPLPAPGAGLAGTLWALIKNASSFGIGDYNNPYDGGGTSQPETGDGTFDFTSTPIALPGVPSIGGYDTGFTSIYNPTSAELKALANYMWAGAFDMENFRKLFSDPMDAIIGLSIIPLTMSQIAGVSSQLVVGNISTGISMKAVSVQYVQVDCGTIQVPSKWGAYLDYAPYTKLQLYLPYIGFVDIAPDDVMDGSIHVQYTVDLMSGTCIAHVMCKDHVLYAFGGNCSCPCPVTSGQYKNGAIGALEIVGTIASTAAQMIPSHKPEGKAAKAASALSGISAVSSGLLDIFGSVQDMVKPAITRAGSIGSAVGLMGIQIPYLVLTVPRMCIPGEQNVYMGYPSFVTKVMGDLVGYTEIEVSHLSNMSCTQEEVDEIISLLGSGVIF